MKIKYKTIDISTQKGLHQAVILRSKGWKIGSTGFITIQLYKKVR